MTVPVLVFVCNDCDRAQTRWPCKGELEELTHPSGVPYTNILIPHPRCVRCEQKMTFYGVLDDPTQPIAQAVNEQPLQGP